MDLFILSSGSCGNSAFLRHEQTRILIDAGMPLRATQRFLRRIDEELEDVEAIFITHEHGDHIRCAEVISRRCEIPVYMSNGTYRSANATVKKIPPERVHLFEPGERFTIGNFEVESVATPHDAAEPVGYVVESVHKRFGVFTDIGYVFPGLIDRVGDLDVLMIESNYDEIMLDDGPYPRQLKERIRGRNGHISNDEAARLVKDHTGDRLRCLVLSHLSEENNHPEVAVTSVKGILGEGRTNDLRVIPANRGYPTTLISV